MTETDVVTNVTYRTLTHRCDDPGCHVVGFAESLTYNDQVLAAQEAALEE